MAQKPKGNTGIKYTAKKLLNAGMRSIRRRYVSKKQTLNYGTLAADVLAMKTLMNVEKKRVENIPSESALIGQVYGNGPAYFAENFAPVQAQGVQEGQRIGNSVKLISSFIKLNFRNGAQQDAPVYFKWFIVETKGTPTTATTVATDLFKPNQWLEKYNSFPGIIDTNSVMDITKMPLYKILRKGSFYIKGDGVNGENSQKGVTIKMKYKNHHIRYDSDAGSNITKGQLTLIILASRGNASGSNSTLNGISDTLSSTGFAVDRHYTNYVVDN